LETAATSAGLLKPLIGAWMIDAEQIEEIGARPHFVLPGPVCHMVTLSSSRRRAYWLYNPEAFEQVLTRMGVAGWRALRMLAVERDTTINALAIEAFNDLLKKYGKWQSVENPAKRNCRRGGSKRTEDL
jgi:hypothetical protein